MKTICLISAVLFVFPSVSWAFDRPLVGPGLSSVVYRQQPIFIPTGLGTIQAQNDGTGPLIVHIEDLHCHYEVQMNIARLIERLAREHGLRLVAVEGAEGPVDVSKLSTFPDYDVRRRVADVLVRQGKLSGPEWAVACGEHPLRLLGIEDESLFEQNRDQARSFLNDESLGLLMDLREGFTRLKPEIYGAGLKRFDRVRTGYREGRLPLPDYARALYREALDRGWDPGAFPELKAYVLPGPLGVANLRPERLEQELERLDQAIRSGLASRPEELRLDEQLRHLETLERLLSISATLEDLRGVRTRSDEFSVASFARALRDLSPKPVAADPDWFRLDAYLRQALDFYHVADQRSEAFVANLAARLGEGDDGLAVLVTGGFHSQEILSNLARRGWAYLSIRPCMEHPDLINPYYALLRKRTTPLEELLARNQNLLHLGTFWPFGDPRRTAAEQQPATVRGFLRTVDLMLKYLLAAKGFRPAIPVESLAARETPVLRQYPDNDPTLQLDWSAARHIRDRFLRVPVAGMDVDALITARPEPSLREAALERFPAWGGRDVLVFQRERLEAALNGLTEVTDIWEPWTAGAWRRTRRMLLPAAIQTGMRNVIVGAARAAMRGWTNVSAPSARGRWLRWGMMAAGMALLLAAGQAGALTTIPAGDPAAATKGMTLGLVFAGIVHPDRSGRELQKIQELFDATARKGFPQKKLRDLFLGLADPPFVTPAARDTIVQKMEEWDRSADIHRRAHALDEREWFQLRYAISMIRHFYRSDSPYVPEQYHGVDTNRLLSMAGRLYAAQGKTLGPSALRDLRHFGEALEEIPGAMAELVADARYPNLCGPASQTIAEVLRRHHLPADKVKFNGMFAHHCVETQVAGLSFYVDGTGGYVLPENGLPQAPVVVPVADVQAKPAEFPLYTRNSKTLVSAYFKPGDLEPWIEELLTDLRAALNGAGRAKKRDPAASKWLYGFILGMGSVLMAAQTAWGSLLSSQPFTTGWFDGSGAPAWTLGLGAVLLGMLWKMSWSDLDADDPEKEVLAETRRYLSKKIRETLAAPGQILLRDLTEYLAYPNKVMIVFNDHQPPESDQSEHAYPRYHSLRTYYATFANMYSRKRRGDKLVVNISASLADHIRHFSRASRHLLWEPLEGLEQALAEGEMDVEQFNRRKSEWIGTFLSETNKIGFTSIDPLYRLLLKPAQNWTREDLLLVFKRDRGIHPNFASEVPAYQTLRREFLLEYFEFLKARLPASGTLQWLSGLSPEAKIDKLIELEYLDKDRPEILEGYVDSRLQDTEEAARLRDGAKALLLGQNAAWIDPSLRKPGTILRGMDYDGKAVEDTVTFSTWYDPEADLVEMSRDPECCLEFARDQARVLAMIPLAARLVMVNGVIETAERENLPLDLAIHREDLRRRQEGLLPLADIGRVEIMTTAPHILYPLVIDQVQAVNDAQGPNRFAVDFQHPELARFALAYMQEVMREFFGAPFYSMWPGEDGVSPAALQLMHAYGVRNVYVAEHFLRQTQDLNPGAPINNHTGFYYQWEEAGRNKRMTLYPKSANDVMGFDMGDARGKPAGLDAALQLARDHLRKPWPEAQQERLNSPEMLARLAELGLPSVLDNSYMIDGENAAEYFKQVGDEGGWLHAWNALFDVLGRRTGKEEHDKEFKRFVTVLPAEQDLIIRRMEDFGVRLRAWVARVGTGSWLDTLYRWAGNTIEQAKSWTLVKAVYEALRTAGLDTAYRDHPSSNPGNHAARAWLFLLQAMTSCFQWWLDHTNPYFPVYDNSQRRLLAQVVEQARLAGASVRLPETVEVVLKPTSDSETQVAASLPLRRKGADGRVREIFPGLVPPREWSASQRSVDVDILSADELRRLKADGKLAKDIPPAGPHPDRLPENPVAGEQAIDRDLQDLRNLETQLADAAGVPLETWLNLGMGISPNAAEKLKNANQVQFGRGFKNFILERAWVEAEIEHWDKFRHRPFFLANGLRLVWQYFRNRNAENLQKTALQKALGDRFGNILPKVTERDRLRQKLEQGAERLERGEPYAATVEESGPDSGAGRADQSVLNILITAAVYGWLAAFYGPMVAPVLTAAFFGVQLGLVLAAWARFNAAQAPERWQSVFRWFWEQRGKIADTHIGVDPEYRHYASWLARRWFDAHERIEKLLPFRWIPGIGPVINHLTATLADPLFAVAAIAWWLWDVWLDRGLPRGLERAPDLQIMDDEAAMSAAVADFLATRIREIIKQKGKCVLCLPTGSTPEQLYRLWSADPERYDLTPDAWKRIHIFHLDEYLGLRPDHPQSFNSVLRRQLLDHVPIPEENINFIDGLAEDPKAEGRRYENLIQEVGGIDLQLLGIGENGHLAFQEPGASLWSRTGVVRLTQSTRRANARFFGSSPVPRQALSLGLGTILEAREIVLLASGDKKQTALADALEGPLTRQVPASVLHLHSRTTVFADRQAAASLSAHRRRQAGRSAAELKMKLAARYAGYDHCRQAAQALQATLTEAILTTDDVVRSDSGWGPSELFQRKMETLRTSLRQLKRAVNDRLENKIPENLQEYFWCWLLLHAHYQHDPDYTFYHAWNVGNLTADMARHNGADPQVVELYRRAGWLHDVGKLLLKKGLLHQQKITDADVARIQLHARAGREILEGLEYGDMVDPVIVDSTTHHETISGRGYDRGLAGDEIPVIGKVLALADSYNAATVRAPQVSEEDRREEFRKLSRGDGPRYDPGWNEVLWHSDRELIPVPHYLFALRVQGKPRGQLVGSFVEAVKTAVRKPPDREDHGFSVQPKTSVANQLRNLPAQDWLGDALTSVIATWMIKRFGPHAGKRLEFWSLNRFDELPRMLADARKRGQSPQQTVAIRVIEQLDDHVRLVVRVDQLANLERLETWEDTEGAAFLEREPTAIALVNLAAYPEEGRVVIRQVALDPKLQRQGYGRQLYQQMKTQLDKVMPGAELHATVIHPTALHLFHTELHMDVDWESLSAEELNGWNKALSLLDILPDPLETPKAETFQLAVRVARKAAGFKHVSDARYLLDRLSALTFELFSDYAKLEGFLEQNYQLEDYYEILQEGVLQDETRVREKLFRMLFYAVPMKTMPSAVTRGSGKNQGIKAFLGVGKWFAAAILPFSGIWFTWHRILRPIAHGLRSWGERGAVRLPGGGDEPTETLNESGDRNNGPASWIGEKALAALCAHFNVDVIPGWAVASRSEAHARIVQALAQGTPGTTPILLQWSEQRGETTMFWIFAETLDNLNHMMENWGRDSESEWRRGRGTLILLMTLQANRNVFKVEYLTLHPSLRGNATGASMMATIVERAGIHFPTCRLEADAVSLGGLISTLRGMSADIPWDSLDSSLQERWRTTFILVGITSGADSDRPLKEICRVAKEEEHSGQASDADYILSKFQLFSRRLYEDKERAWEFFRARQLVIDHPLMREHLNTMNQIEFNEMLFQTLLGMVPLRSRNPAEVSEKAARSTAEDGAMAAKWKRAELNWKHTWGRTTWFGWLWNKILHPLILAVRKRGTRGAVRLPGGGGNEQIGQGGAVDTDNLLEALKAIPPEQWLGTQALGLLRRQFNVDEIPSWTVSDSRAPGRFPRDTKGKRTRKPGLLQIVHRLPDGTIHVHLLMDSLERLGKLARWPVERMRLEAQLADTPVALFLEFSPGRACVFDSLSIARRLREQGLGGLLAQSVVAQVHETFPGKGIRFVAVHPAMAVAASRSGAVIDWNALGDKRLARWARTFEKLGLGISDERPTREKLRSLLREHQDMHGAASVGEADYLLRLLRQRAKEFRKDPEAGIRFVEPSTSAGAREIREGYWSENTWMVYLYRQMLGGMTLEVPPKMGAVDGTAASARSADTQGTVRYTDTLNRVLQAWHHYRLDDSSEKQSLLYVQTRSEAEFLDRKKGDWEQYQQDVLSRAEMRELNAWETAKIQAALDHIVPIDPADYGRAVDLIHGEIGSFNRAGESGEASVRLFRLPESSADYSSEDLALKLVDKFNFLNVLLVDPLTRTVYIDEDFWQQAVVQQWRKGLATVKVNLLVGSLLAEAAGALHFLRLARQSEALERGLSRAFERQMKRAGDLYNVQLFGTRLNHAVTAYVEQKPGAGRKAWFIAGLNLREIPWYGSAVRNVRESFSGFFWRSTRLRRVIHAWEDVMNRRSFDAVDLEALSGSLRQVLSVLGSPEQDADSLLASSRTALTSLRGLRAIMSSCLYLRTRLGYRLWGYRGENRKIIMDNIDFVGLSQTITLLEDMLDPDSLVEPVDIQQLVERLTLTLAEFRALQESLYENRDTSWQWPYRWGIFFNRKADEPADAPADPGLLGGLERGDQSLRLGDRMHIVVAAGGGGDFLAGLRQAQFEVAQVRDLQGDIRRHGEEPGAFRVDVAGVAEKRYGKTCPNQARRVLPRSWGRLRRALIWAGPALAVLGLSLGVAGSLAVGGPVLMAGLMVLGIGLAIPTLVRPVLTDSQDRWEREQNPIYVIDEIRVGSKMFSRPDRETLEKILRLEKTLGIRFPKHFRRRISSVMRPEELEGLEPVHGKTVFRVTETTAVRGAARRLDEAYVLQEMRRRGDDRDLYLIFLHENIGTAAEDFAGFAKDLWRERGGSGTLSMEFLDHGGDAMAFAHAENKPSLVSPANEKYVLKMIRSMKTHISELDYYFTTNGIGNDLESYPRFMNNILRYFLKHGGFRELWAPYARSMRAAAYDVQTVAGKVESYANKLGMRQLTEMSWANRWDASLRLIGGIRPLRDGLQFLLRRILTRARTNIFQHMVGYVREGRPLRRPDEHQTLTFASEGLIRKWTFSARLDPLIDLLDAREEETIRRICQGEHVPAKIEQAISVLSNQKDTPRLTMAQIHRTFHELGIVTEEGDFSQDQMPEEIRLPGDRRADLDFEQILRDAGILPESSGTPWRGQHPEEKTDLDLVHRIMDVLSDTGESILGVWLARWYKNYFGTERVALRPVTLTLESVKQIEANLSIFSRNPTGDLVAQMIAILVNEQVPGGILSEIHRLLAIYTAWFTLEETASGLGLAAERDYVALATRMLGRPGFFLPDSRPEILLMAPTAKGESRQRVENLRGIFEEKLIQKRLLTPSDRLPRLSGSLDSMAADESSVTRWLYDAQLLRGSPEANVVLAESKTRFAEAKLADAKRRLTQPIMHWGERELLNRLRFFYSALRADFRLPGAGSEELLHELEKREWITRDEAGQLLDMSDLILENQYRQFFDPGREDLGEAIAGRVPEANRIIEEVAGKLWGLTPVNVELGLWPLLTPLYRAVDRWGSRHFRQPVGRYLGLVLAPAAIESGLVGLWIIGGMALLSRAFGVPTANGPPLWLLFVSGQTLWHALHAVFIENGFWRLEWKRAVAPATLEITGWSTFGLGLSVFFFSASLTLGVSVVTVLLGAHILVQIRRLHGVRDRHQKTNRPFIAAKAEQHQSTATSWIGRLRENLLASRLFSERVLDYYSSFGNLINPDGKEMTAVAGASGPRIAEILLQTHFTKYGWRMRAFQKAGRRMKKSFQSSIFERSLVPESGYPYFRRPGPLLRGVRNRLGWLLFFKRQNTLAFRIPVSTAKVPGWMARAMLVGNKVRTSSRTADDTSVRDDRAALRELSRREFVPDEIEQNMLFRQGIPVRPLMIRRLHSDQPGLGYYTLQGELPPGGRERGATIYLASALYEALIASEDEMRSKPSIRWRRELAIVAAHRLLADYQAEERADIKLRSLRHDWKKKVEGMNQSWVRIGVRLVQVSGYLPKPLRMAIHRTWRRWFPGGYLRVILGPEGAGLTTVLTTGSLGRQYWIWSQTNDEDDLKTLLTNTLIHGFMSRAGVNQAEEGEECMESLIVFSRLAEQIPELRGKVIGEWTSGPRSGQPCILPENLDQGLTPYLQNVWRTLLDSLPIKLREPLAPPVRPRRRAIGQAA